MNDTRLTTLRQVEDFLLGTHEVSFTGLTDDRSGYAFVQCVLVRFDFARLGRSQRGLIRRYLQRATGYSRAQITRLVGRFVADGEVVPGYRAPRTAFTRKYLEADVRLLAELDALHGTLAGPATRVLLARACGVFGDARYTNLAGISVAHLYNLRKRAGYLSVRRHWTKTRNVPVAIGVRRAPQHDGIPGYIRIDSVHQGDQDGFKGVYHINAVDCVTQWELVATCERISEAYLLPVIQALLEGFPFAIHADNGSEYVNQDVAKLLNKLRVEFTRSRPRQSNDNALAETKNGAVVRKIFGYSHIPQRFATQVNAFCAEHLNPYVNFHRPSCFAVDQVSAKGKIIKRYPQDQIMTPFDKLKTLPKAAAFLKPGITLETLGACALAITDNQAAQQLNTARIKLFHTINRRPNTAA